MPVTKICCIGANNIGGSFCTILAYKCPAIEVKVVDEDEEKIIKWNSPQLPIFENNLQEIIQKCRGKNLFFTSESKTAIDEADIIFICVNTELKTQGMGKGMAANLKPLEDAARLIAESATTSKIVVEKSTASIRGAETVSNILKADPQDRKFTVLSNPEFLTQGNAVKDLLFPERVLIGGDKSPQAAVAIETLISIYENWVPRSNILTADTWSTELAKLATNALLAQKICSINSLSEVCEATNADVSEVASAIGMDSRIGPKALTASIGFGGPCLQKDLLSILYLCESLNLPQITKYWQRVIDLNEHQKRRFTKNIIDAFFGALTDKYFAILGFSFKKGTAETTESPAIFVCKTLLEEGAKLKIFDPIVPKKRIVADLKTACEYDDEKLATVVTIVDDPYDATAGTYGIVICTNWEEFASIDYYKVYNDMIKPAHIFDGWKMLPHKELLQIGFKVHTIGKNLNPDPSTCKEIG